MKKKVENKSRTRVINPRSIVSAVSSLATSPEKAKIKLNSPIQSENEWLNEMLKCNNELLSDEVQQNQTKITDLQNELKRAREKILKQKEKMKNLTLIACQTSRGTNSSPKSRRAFNLNQSIKSNVTANTSVVLGLSSKPPIKVPIQTKPLKFVRHGRTESSSGGISCKSSIGITHGDSKKLEEEIMKVRDENEDLNSRLTASKETILELNIQLNAKHKKMGINRESWLEEKRKLEKRATEMEKEIEQLRLSKSKLQQNLKESTIGYSTLQRLFEIEEKKNRESAKTIQELQSKQVQSKAAQIPLIASAVGARKLQSPQNLDKPELFHSKTERQKLFFNPLDSLFS